MTSGNSASLLIEANDDNEPAYRGVLGLELFEGLLPVRFGGMALGRCVVLATDAWFLQSSELVPTRELITFNQQPFNTLLTMNAINIPYCKAVIARTT